MTTKELLNNRYEISSTIRPDLIRILEDLERVRMPYQTDIYLYFTEDGEPYLTTFINIGGNSWLNDDHIKLWSIRPHDYIELDYMGNEYTVDDLIENEPSYFEDKADAILEELWDELEMELMYG